MADALLTSQRRSFRDPAGEVIDTEARILRRVNKEALESLERVLRAQDEQRLQGVVGTKRLDVSPVEESGGDSVWLEHERIPFVSYPYEWPAEMLHAAGELTLALAEQALTVTLGLKDATPYNVLFRGPQPWFVDVLSFEPRDPQDPTWLPQAQFERTILLPLLAYKHLGIPTGETLLVRRDGLDPTEFFRRLSLGKKLHPDFLGSVSLPHWLDRKSGQQEGQLYQPRRARSAEEAKFILGMMFRMCRRRLEKAKPQTQASTWTGYMSSHSYEGMQFAAKEAFVSRALAGSKPAWVLDVGCNTGHFSEMAAKSGAEVVAVDQDPAVVGAVWRRAKEQGLPVLPLVVDLSRPTPAMGWRNMECQSFLERASTRFDLVLMLAVIHHMLVTERIPLEEILQSAASWSRKEVLVEFVAPEDSMFLRLTRGRDHLFRGLTREVFENACRRWFRIAAKQEVPQSHRTLYLLSKEC
ncbi:MAG: class I SAM-dependent methyltransferase [Bryobacteraceae bacterium]